MAEVREATSAALLNATSGTKFGDDGIDFIACDAPDVRLQGTFIIDALVDPTQAEIESAVRSTWQGLGIKTERMRPRTIGVLGTDSSGLEVTVITVGSQRLTVTLTSPCRKDPSRGG